MPDPLASPLAGGAAFAPVIGIFDSGVGGLSVLGALRRRLPEARVHYIADSAHAPYGERSEAFVLERSRTLTAHLLGEGARLVVVACNTATAVAIHALRAEWPQVRFVGVEPGIKPALALTRNGRIGVMATRRTLHSDKFRRLLDAHAAGVELHLQECAGLAQALEEGDADSPLVAALVERHAAPLRAAGVDTVVLGCTHYPFAARQIRAQFGAEVVLVDTAQAVAQQVERQVGSLESHASQAESGTAGSVLWTSGDPPTLTGIATRWLGLEMAAEPLPTIAMPSLGHWCPEPAPSS